MLVVVVVTEVVVVVTEVVVVTGVAAMVTEVEVEIVDGGNDQGRGRGQTCGKNAK